VSAEHEVTVGIAIPVVCAIIVHQDKILCARRPTGSSQAGLWEFPGGKVNDGELPEDALIREIREELAVTISINSPLTPVIHRYPTKQIKLIPFICSIDSGTVIALEHSDIKWCAIPEAECLEWAPADVPVLNEYKLTMGF
jgi:8-oxo-dGTP diphosphatase